MKIGKLLKPLVSEKNDEVLSTLSSCPGISIPTGIGIKMKNMGNVFPVTECSESGYFHKYIE